MRNALAPSVACSETTVPPPNGFLSSNELINFTGGPASSTADAASGAIKNRTMKSLDMCLSFDIRLAFCCGIPIAGFAKTVQVFLRSKEDMCSFKKGIADGAFQHVVLVVICEPAID